MFLMILDKTLGCFVPKGRYYGNHLEGNVTTQFDKAGQGRIEQDTFLSADSNMRKGSLQIPMGLTKNYFTSILPKLDWSQIANSYPYVVFLMGQTDSVVKI